MRLAIMGSGGVGGYFGARLAQGGANVTFIARGAHLGAMRERGLRVESPLGDLYIADPKVTTIRPRWVRLTWFSSVSSGGTRKAPPARFSRWSARQPA